jgi:uncharacterized membrane protein
VQSNVSLTGAGVFVILLLPFVIWSSLVIPPFQIADEFVHYCYALAISRGEPLAYSHRGAVGAVLPRYALELHKSVQQIAHNPKQKFSAAQQAAFNAVADDGVTEFVSFPGSAVYGPIVYAAPATVLAASNVLHLSPALAFYGGRLANALLFVSIGATAILLAPPSVTGAFLISLLLPMSIFQSASYSADAAVFPVSALVAALVSRQMTDPSDRAWGLGVIAALGVGTAAMAKLPMIPMALPLSLVFGQQNWKRGTVVGLTALAIPLIWYLAFSRPEAHHHPGVSIPGQLHYLLSNPPVVFPVAVNTLSAYWHPYLQEMIGVLGWLDTRLPVGSYAFFGSILLAVFALSAVGRVVREDRQLPQQLFIVIAILISCGLTFAALYLTWSPVGAAKVAGVQGRYFLPYLPWLAVAVAPLGQNRIWQRMSFATALGGATIALPLTAWVVVIRYYLS